MTDLREGHGLEIIYKNRSRKKDGTEIRGGGVAMVYDKTKIDLRPFPIKKTTLEILVATGKIPKVQRKMALICAYIPPNSTAKSYKATFKLISDTIQTLKAKLKEPLILVGGDFNRFDVRPWVESFEDVSVLDTGITCNNASLDKIATNIQECKTSIRQPLSCDASSQTSDHSVILLEADLQENHRFSKRVIHRRKFTEEGLQTFGKLLLNVDWVSEYKTVEDDADLQVRVMDRILEKISEQSFKMRRVVIKSTDAPWMNPHLQRKIYLRKKSYKKNGDSSRWRKKKAAVKTMIKKAKAEYWSREEEKLKQLGSHNKAYRAIQCLKSHDRPKNWEINELNPQMSDAELAEDLALFFNRISHEFTPLDGTEVEEDDSEPVFLQPHEVSAHLRSFKKPKSTVAGDVFPKCVSTYHDILAIPLTKIFNTIIATKRWPQTWKLETTTVIPKTSTASTYGECRNLSCTPLFSKVMESFLMDRIYSEVQIDAAQYGGIKKCGADHFLTQSWDHILRSLDDNRASVNLITIDYAKAFNRMSHQECLKAFKRKGTTKTTLGLIAAFLTDRSMMVKVGEATSTKKQIFGGSPQGCVSANSLFCATIEALQSGQLEQGNSTNNNVFIKNKDDNYTLYAGDTILFDIPSVDASPEYAVPFEHNGSGFSRSHYEDQSDLEHQIVTHTPIQRPMAGRRKLNKIWDTFDASTSFRPNISDFERLGGAPLGWKGEEFWLLKYIDDGLGGEKLYNLHA